MREIIYSYQQNHRALCTAIRQIHHCELVQRRQQKVVAGAGVEHRQLVQQQGAEGNYVVVVVPVVVAVVAVALGNLH